MNFHTLQALFMWLGEYFTHQMMERWCWCVSMHVKQCAQSNNKNGHDTDIWVLSEEGNYLFMSKGNNTTTGDPQ